MMGVVFLEGWEQLVRWSEEDDEEEGDGEDGR